jgi:hypothetical protein
MQPTLQRRYGNSQYLRRFWSRDLFYIAKQQDGALVLLQLGQRTGERPQDLPPGDPIVS